MDAERKVGLFGWTRWSFKDNFWDVSKLLQRRFRDASEMSQRCFRLWTSEMLQRCIRHNSATMNGLSEKAAAEVKNKFFFILTHSSPLVRLSHTPFHRYHRRLGGGRRAGWKEADWLKNKADLNSRSKTASLRDRVFFWFGEACQVCWNLYTWKTTLSLLIIRWLFRRF